jgi:hypothetical protein
MDSLDPPRKRKIGMRFRIWKVRSLYRAGTLKTVASEMARYNVDLVKYITADG